jgi:putative transposase
LSDVLDKVGLENMSMHRRSIRIPKYDYSQCGAYFITIVTQKRVCLFGNIHNYEMVLNAAGEMIDQVCREIPIVLKGVELDHYQIMPNHFHGIIVLNPIESQLINDLTVGADLRVCPGQPRRVAPTQNPFAFFDIVQRFKSLTTRRYIDGVRNQNWPRFDNRLWQRNYYERVIRNDREHQALVDYIFANPSNWEDDQENLSHHKSNE